MSLQIQGQLETGEILTGSEKGAFKTLKDALSAAPQPTWFAEYYDRPNVGRYPTCRGQLCKERFFNGSLNCRTDVRETYPKYDYETRKKNNSSIGWSNTGSAMTGLAFQV